MAERRMFSKTLMFSNSFTRLSRTATQLYFFLCLSADDDGFADNTDSICRMCRCTGRYLQELVDSSWVIRFDSGVIAIAHWYMHNQIKKDRYKPTIYQKERSMLEKTSTGMYVLLDPNRIHFGSNLDPQGSIDQERTVQESIDQDSIGKDRPEEDNSGCPSSGPEPPACDDEFDCEKVFEYYQCVCPKLMPCEVLTPKLREKMEVCHREGITQLHLLNTFMQANESLFLQGDNRRGWQADLGWLLDPLHVREVDAGKYDTWM